MKIYFSQTQDPKIVGVAQGMETFEPDCFFWHRGQMSLFDLIQEQKPSIMFLNDEDDADHVKYAKHEFPETMFVLFTNKNEKPEGFDLILNMSDPNEDWYVPYLSNSVSFGGGRPTKQFTCDFVMFSNRLDGNNKDMLKWLCALGNRYRFKIYGTNRLPIPYYLGQPMPDEYRNIFQSCKAVIMMDDEWYYDTINNGKFPLLFSREKDKPWKFDQYEEIIDLCDKVLAHPPELVNWWQELSTGIKEKTYTHLARRIVEELK